VTSDIGWIAGGPSQPSMVGENVWLHLEWIEPDFIQSGEMEVYVTGRPYAQAYDSTTGPYLFDPETHRVFYKNNCPGQGKLYDSFSICTNDEANDVVIWCTPSSGHKSVEGQAELVDFRIKTEEVHNGKSIVANSWKELTHKLTTDPILYAASFDSFDSLKEA
jgi:hypothetical protein